ncbi:MAG: hypothetical protein GY719_20050 [bacterium]|nr:hypothetical protein [bacterium]
MSEKIKAPVKESGKSSFAPQSGKGAFAPRGFAVQRKEAVVQGAEQGRGDLLDAYLEREARVEAARGATGVGAEVEGVLKGRFVGDDGDAAMQLRKRDDGGEVENRTGMPDRLKAPIQMHRVGTPIGAEFGDMPNGKLDASYDDLQGYLGDTFAMNATFDPDQTDAGGWGEYRQYVKGYVKADDRVIQHEIGDGSFLAEDSWKEDSATNNGVWETYGNRALEGSAGNRYIDDDEGGSRFEGSDSPGLHWRVLEDGEDKLEINMKFKAELIDTDTPDSAIKTKLWSVEGEEAGFAEDE